MNDNDVIYEKIVLEMNIKICKNQSTEGLILFFPLSHMGSR